MVETPDTARPDCFGEIFPDLSRLEWNKPCQGKAFTVLVTTLGIGVKSRQVDLDQAAWEKCRRCPSYGSCYDVGMAKLALTHALK
jgi:hypothetical protein